MVPVYLSILITRSNEARLAQQFVEGKLFASSAFAAIPPYFQAVAFHRRSVGESRLSHPLLALFPALMDALDAVLLAVLTNSGQLVPSGSAPAELITIRTMLLDLLQYRDRLLHSMTAGAFDLERLHVHWRAFVKRAQRFLGWCQGHR